MKIKLSVMLVDENPERSSLVADYLSDAGYDVVCQLDNTEHLTVQIEQVQPDVIVLDVDSPDRDTLEDVHLATKNAPRPIVLFTDESDQNTMDKAIKTGISAYVVDGLSKSRIKPIIEVAVARFQEYQSLRSELDDVKSRLADRKDIDIAKGLLQKQYSLSEARGYQALRKIAMDQKITIGEAARSLISISKIVSS